MVEPKFDHVRSTGSRTPAARAFLDNDVPLKGIVVGTVPFCDFLKDHMSVLLLSAISSVLTDSVTLREGGPVPKRDTKARRVRMRKWLRRSTCLWRP